MKHERVIEAVDQVPSTFVRSFALCLLAGAAMWAAIIAVMI